MSLHSRRIPPQEEDPPQQVEVEKDLEEELKKVLAMVQHRADGSAQSCE